MNQNFKHMWNHIAQNLNINAKLSHLRFSLFIFQFFLLSDIFYSYLIFLFAYAVFPFAFVSTFCAWFSKCCG